MKNSRTLTCCNQKSTLDILSQLKVHIQITDNPYGLKLEELFEMAARMNKKRSFLFVSKLLGKHIPINPATGLATGLLLANRYMEAVYDKEIGKKEEWLSYLSGEHKVIDDSPFIGEGINPVIIGFAETATALGHAFYQSFTQADFFHTTREILKSQTSVINFEEEHSHATSHRSYIPEVLLDNSREIILVDDEMTTGKTAINIIRSIQEKYPRTTYSVVSILDWRSDDHKKQFALLEQELGIRIKAVSLLSGTIEVDGAPEPGNQQITDYNQSQVTPFIEEIYLEEIFPQELEGVEQVSVTLDGVEKSIPYMRETGRFGLHATENASIHLRLETIAEELNQSRTGLNTLCLGTGEFMYIPMKIASMMGDGVSYHSTTRSPIYTLNQKDYGAKFGLSFPNPDDQQIAQFVYNIPPKEYDEIFVFFERAITKEKLAPFLAELEKTETPNVKIVYFKGGKP
ncbi:phosphoribosyltransferase family protein [Cytobacillus purgationiresistens]|uniref:DNA polymerase III delta prime subunit n=1 Tax=Cytobacillus purgationiresistens TaxID=863449 RepID=A0ABU0AL73_9BACI|nr:phosphoribosyltransferase family protein [Cytobacillus purgationiresistens]MDQ0272018.1 DNA polymerase III delta prime subunit [Cytobacillus purgationiresistens]